MGVYYLPFHMVVEVAVVILVGMFSVVVEVVAVVVFSTDASVDAIVVELLFSPAVVVVVA